MAHPYRSAGRSGAKLKFSKMLGTTTGAKHLNDDSVVAPKPLKNGVDDIKIMGKTPPKRIDRARGGKVGKTIVNVNIDSAAQKPPLPPILPPMPPPGAGPGPAAMPPKPPMMPPPGMGAGPTPGAGLPMPKARGGYISGKAKDNQLKQWAQYSRKNSYHKKSGGGISKAVLIGGADSGVGRLQHSKQQGKSSRRGK